MTGEQVALGILDRAGQDVQLVMELVERLLGDDQLVLVELQLGCALLTYPVPLATSL